MIRKLLSLPPNLVREGKGGATIFHDITGLKVDEYFCTCDPDGQRIGSGGGTAWLLAHQPADFARGKEKRLILHAGGQSRRLPAYAPSGKILTPIPVLRWERGQQLEQDLLSLQVPFYERMLEKAPETLRTMVVSGDVLVRSSQSLGAIPEADVVCYGLWLDASVACHHGVFVSSRQTPHVLKQMLQKPPVEQLQQLQSDHYYLTDIGIWLLSDRAVELLMKRSFTPCHKPRYYDLYSDFGRALGTHPELDDAELRQLSVAILPLTGGEFYHFGTSRELISSMLRLQNVVSDQRQIMHHDCKPHPAIFIQNSLTELVLSAQNTHVWIENSHIGPHWKLTHDHIITGVPHNDWHVSLSPGECIDIVPIGEDRYAVRRYHIDDRFDGAEQQRPQFPVVNQEELQMLMEQGTQEKWPLQSAEQLSSQAHLGRLFAQREQYRVANWSALARNWQHSVFYQLDLDDAARQFAHHHITLPPALPDDAPLMTRIHDAMFRGDAERAFGLLRQGLVECGGWRGGKGESAVASLCTIGGETCAVANSPLSTLHSPLPKIESDQIVWARSPVRIDIAGGWTDTPPYCLIEGGQVVNLAIELNGQQPLQAYVKPVNQLHIVLRSIDLGASEVIETYEQLAQYNQVGSPFSIPKAALALAGFLPQFSAENYPSLRVQLEQLGCGLELTMLSAIPAGSGLGTSSILAATVLGALNDFCSLAWDKNEIGYRTLILEQLLTTGGGWQDQYGGVLGGVKLLQTEPGFQQTPMVRWLPTDVYTRPEYQQCHLLYYTGITRTAKSILAEIVRRMFLNHHDQLALLRQMREHASHMYDALQRQNFVLMGQLVRQTWAQNQLLDNGTNPPEVHQLTHLIDDLCLGYKLPGAGGGGYLYMVAKDPDAAARIKRVLTEHQQRRNARFVDMSLSTTGLQVSRS